AYNGQITVDKDHQIILGQHITQKANDKQEVKPALQEIKDTTGKLPDRMSLDNGYMCRTLIIFEQKNGAIDTLPLNQKAMGILEDRRKKKMPDCDLAFPSQNGTRILDRNLFRAFHNAMERAQIENFRFHDLRHTFATRLVQASVGIYEVQKLGRWKNASMVMRYAHHNPESLRSSIEVLDSFEKPFITILAQFPKKEGLQASLKLATP
ncbi:MAG: tyrosine-type recombinase/integrase, partial [Smithella sp.]